MDNDFEIELLDKDEAEDSEASQLPTNFISFGELERDDVQVYIRQDVYNALEKYACEDTENERGTFLLGNYYEEMGKTHVIISNYIEAKYTDASAATLTFTHETWEYVHKEHDENYPDTKIVGWQHTHPGYGIFLSNYDTFIQENFFNLPFQVAYVIDPVQDIRGFFQWKNGKIEKLNGYYIYDETGTPIEIKKEKHSEATSVKNSSRIITTAIAAVSLAALIVCLFVISSLRNQLDESKSAQMNMEQQLYSQGKEIEEQQSTIDTLYGIIAEHEEDSRYVEYTVKSGDTLGKICTTLGIDYQQNKAEILSLNNISDENVILVGQTLVFPQSMVSAPEN